MALRVRENADPVITFGEGETPVDAGTYAVTDQDGSIVGSHPYDDTSYTYSVTGTESDVVAFDAAGVLNFREEHDPDGGVTVKRWVWERSEKITVDEDGVPSAECRDDAGTPGVGVVAGWSPIDGAMSAVYGTRPSDVGRCLRVTATYTDNIDNAADDADERATRATEAPVQARNPANTTPHFVGRTDRTSRRAAENTEAGKDIGVPISAHDDDE